MQSRRGALCWLVATKDDPTLPKPVPRRRLIDPGLVIILVLAVAGAVTVHGKEGWSGVLRVVADDTWLFIEILPKVAAGCVIGALITILVPREVVVKLVGTESGARGLVIATVAGIVVPGGPFTVFPVTVAFLSIGADRGAAAAFVIAWHVIGLNRAIIWEMPFFGPDFVMLRMAVSVAFPFIAGVTARLIPAPRTELP